MGPTSWGAPAQVVAASWWIAAQLVRWHPDLLAYEMHPGGGMYDILAVTPPEQVSPDAAPNGARILLNRAGSVHVQGGPDSGPIGQWSDFLLSDDPFEVVRGLERAAGWVAPAKTPGATPRSLAYRFIASALVLFADDRRAWDARSEFLDSSGDDDERPKRISLFPLAHEQLVRTRPLGIYGEPYSRFWCLLRGSEPIAIVSDEAQVYLASGEHIDVEQEYSARGRRIRRVTADAFHAWM